MEKQFPVDFKFIILFRSDRRMIRTLVDDLILTDMWSATCLEGFDYINESVAGLGTQSCPACNLLKNVVSRSHSVVNSGDSL